MRPIPRVVGSVVGVEHIVARVLQILCRSLGLLHISADLNVVLSGHRALAEALHLGLYRVTKRYGVVLAARLLDRLDDLCGEAVTVLKASAVIVGTLIEKFYCKLVKQVSLVYRVDLDAVDARIHTKLCGLCKRLDDLVDLLYRHLGADDIVRPSRRLGRGRCKLVAGIYDRLYDRAGEFVLVKRCYKLGDRPGASHTCGKLHEELCAGLMYLVHKFLELLEHLRVLPEPLTPEGVAKGRNSGDDKTYVVVGSLDKELCRFLVEVTSAKLKPTEERRAAHRAHYDTVLDLHVSYFPRGKQSVVFCVHNFLLIFLKGGSASLDF